MSEKVQIALINGAAIVIPAILTVIAIILQKSRKEINGRITDFLESVRREAATGDRVARMEGQLQEQGERHAREASRAVPVEPAPAAVIPAASAAVHQAAILQAQVADAAVSHVEKSSSPTPRRGTEP